MPIDYSNYGAPVERIDGKTEWKYSYPTDLIARLIYAEARGESYTGKQGIYWSFAYRLALDIDEFGHSTYEIIIEKGRYDGVTTDAFYAPERDTQVWKDCVDIAVLGASNPNPIGNCPWFNTNDTYKSLSYPNNLWRYHFGIGQPYQDVVEKHVIGNHTFFRVAGSQYEL